MGVMRGSSEDLLTIRSRAYRGSLPFKKFSPVSLLSFSPHVCSCTVSSLNLRVRQTRTRIDPCKISHLSPTLVTSPLPRRNSAQGQWHYCLHECRIYSFVRVSFSTSNLTTSSDGGLERIPVRVAARLRPRLVRSDQTLNDLQKDNDTLKSKVSSDVTWFHCCSVPLALLGDSVGQGAGRDGDANEETQARVANCAARDEQDCQSVQGGSEPD